MRQYESYSRSSYEEARLSCVWFDCVWARSLEEREESDNSLNGGGGKYFGCILSDTAGGNENEDVTEEDNVLFNEKGCWSVCWLAVLRRPNMLFAWPSRWAADNGASPRVFIELKGNRKGAGFVEGGDIVPLHDWIEDAVDWIRGVTTWENVDNRSVGLEEDDPRDFKEHGKRAPGVVQLVDGVVDGVTTGSEVMLFVGVDIWKGIMRIFAK